MASLPQKTLSAPKVIATENKAAVVSKMRAKLAGPSMDMVNRSEKDELKANTKRVGVLWRAIALAVIIGLNLFVFGFKAETFTSTQKSQVQSLPTPHAKMEIDQQLLYWTYALHDFEKLKAEFSTGDKVIINRDHALQQIALLMPKASPGTVFKARIYQGSGGKLK
jgi:hypothetical protein